MAVEIVASTQPLLKHGVRGRHPLQQEPALSKGRAEAGDVSERQLMTQDEMMHDREHEHQVKFASEAVEKGQVLAIAPTGRGRRAGDVRNQGCDWLVTIESCSPELFESGGIAVESDNTRARIGGQQ